MAPHSATALAEGVLHTVAKDLKSVEKLVEKDIHKAASTGLSVAGRVRRGGTDGDVGADDYDSNMPDSGRVGSARDPTTALSNAVLHNLMAISDADHLLDSYERENYIDPTWLNTIVKELWKHIEASGRKILDEEVLPKMKAEVKKSAKMLKKFGIGAVNPEDVGVEQFFLGDTAASVGPTRLQRKSYTKPDGTKAQALQLDVSLLFDDTVQITVNAGFLVLEICHMRFSGELTMLMRPLVKEVPIIAGVQLFFLNTPDIRYDFKVSGEKPSRTMKVLLNLVKDNVKRSVMAAVESAFVVPNRKTLKLKVSQEISATIDWDTVSHGQALGVLRVRLASATTLKSSDISLFKRGGSSDPYGVVRVGSQQIQTSVMYGKLSPVWHQLEWYDFLVHSSRQKLYVEIFDRDFGSADDTLGKFPSLTVLEFLSQATLQADGQTFEVTKDLDLSQVDDAEGLSSTGTLQFRWMSLEKVPPHGLKPVDLSVSLNTMTVERDEELEMPPQRVSSVDEMDAVSELKIKNELEGFDEDSPGAVAADGERPKGRVARAASIVTAEPKPTLSSTCMGRTRQKVGHIIDSNIFQVIIMLIILFDVSYNLYILSNPDTEESPVIQWIINILLAMENLSRMFYLSPSIFFRHWMCVLEFIIVVISIVFQIVQDSQILNPTFLRALRPGIRCLKTLKTLVQMRSHMRAQQLFVPKDLNVALMSVDIHGGRGFPPDMKGIKVTVSVSLGTKTIFTASSVKSRIERPRAEAVEDVDQHLQTTIGRMVMLGGLSHQKVAEMTDLGVEKVQSIIQAQTHTFMRWDQTITAMLTDPLNSVLDLELKDSKTGSIGRTSIPIKDIADSAALTERAAYELRLVPAKLEEIAMRTGVDQSLVQCFLCVTLKLRYLQPTSRFGKLLLPADLEQPLVAGPVVAQSDLLTDPEKRVPPEVGPQTAPTADQGPAAVPVSEDPV